MVRYITHYMLRLKNKQIKYIPLQWHQLQSELFILFSARKGFKILRNENISNVMSILFLFIIHITHVSKDTILRVKNWLQSLASAFSRVIEINLVYYRDAGFFCDILINIQWTELSHRTSTYPIEIENIPIIRSYRKKCAWQENSYINPCSFLLSFAVLMYTLYGLTILKFVRKACLVSHDSHIKTLQLMCFFL